MGTVAAENEYSFLAGRDFFGVAIQLPTWGCRKIAMSDFPHTQSAYLFGCLNNGKGMWFRCEQPFLSGERCVTARKTAAKQTIR